MIRGNSRIWGYTLFEVVAVVAVIGVISAVAVRLMAPDNSPAEFVKLETDVRAVNSAARIYRAFGGSLDSVSTPQDVLEKLKTKADSVSAEQVAGLTGSFIDRRIMAVMQTAAEALTDQRRAVWDFTRERFVVVTSGPAGVRRFELDNTITSGPALVEARGNFLNLATVDDWIWDYTDMPAATPVEPTHVPTYTTAGGTAVMPPPPPPPPSPGQLAPPVSSVITGLFPITNYDLQLYFTDPNPVGVGQVVYSINSSVWTNYTGAPVAVPPGANVRAYTQVVDLAWTDSTVTNHTYDASPAQLAVPVISSDDPQFEFSGSADKIKVTITNLNDPVVSLIEYRVNGAAWQAYSGSFDLEVFDYSSGAEVEARAVSTSVYWIGSDLASHFIPGPVGTQLNPPVISFSDPRFSAAVTSIDVTITDPNAGGDSDPYYQIVSADGAFAGSFVLYGGTFSVAQASYPDGFAVRAYARAKMAPFTDSDFVEHSTGSYFGDDVNSGGLTGRFYDLKQYADGSPTNIEADTVDFFNQTYYNYLIQMTPEITAGSEWGFNPAVLEQFYSPSKTLYGSRFATPDLDAALAPDVYGVGGVIAPTNWMAHYSGSVEPANAGMYRFSGRGDDALMIWIDGKLVLSGAYWPWEVTATFPWTGAPDWSGYVATHPDPPYTDASYEIQTEPLFGVWVYLDGRHDIDIVVGEQPGGDFYVNLRVEEQGVTYPDGPQIFTTKTLSGDDAIEVQGANPTSVPGTSNPPVFYLLE